MFDLQKRNSRLGGIITIHQNGYEEALSSEEVLNME